MMKKILFPALALLLAACLSPSGDAPTPSLTPDTSHLTPATPTLIPTPTPHPDFLKLQEKIAAGGETFTLTQDGQIEMWTEEEGARIVPGIQVHPDGTMTFTHEGQKYEVDTETLEIQDQTITFEDTEGKTWVLDEEGLQSEAVALAKADFRKYNYDYSALEFSQDEEGKTIAVDLETGRVVYRDGLFDVRYAVANASDLVPTEYGVKVWRWTPNRPADPEKLDEYTVPLLHRAIAEFARQYGYGDPPDDDKEWTFSVLCLDPETLSWGMVMWYKSKDLAGKRATPETPRYLAFETRNGQIMVVPLMRDFDSGDIYDFWTEGWWDKRYPQEEN